MTDAFARGCRGLYEAMRLFPARRNNPARRH